MLVLLECKFLHFVSEYVRGNVNFPACTLLDNKEFQFLLIKLLRFTVTVKHSGKFPPILCLNICVPAYILDLFCLSIYLLPELFDAASKTDHAIQFLFIMCAFIHLTCLPIAQSNTICNAFC